MISRNHLLGHPYAGRHNLQSFLAANATQNYFLIAHMLIFFATKVPYFTFCDKFWYRKWIEGEEIKREWENLESESLSISSFSLLSHSLSIFSFSLHILFISSCSLLFPPSPAARLQRVAEACPYVIWLSFGETPTPPHPQLRNFEQPQRILCLPGK